MTFFQKNDFIQNWSGIKTTSCAHAKKYIFKIKLWDCNFHQILPTYSYPRVTYSDPGVTYSDPKVTHSDPTHLPLPTSPTSPGQHLVISLVKLNFWWWVVGGNQI